MMFSVVSSGVMVIWTPANFGTISPIRNTPFLASNLATAPGHVSRIKNQTERNYWASKLSITKWSTVKLEVVISADNSITNMKTEGNSWRILVYVNARLKKHQFYLCYHTKNCLATTAGCRKEDDKSNSGECITISCLLRCAIIFGWRSWNVSPGPQEIQKSGEEISGC